MKKNHVFRFLPLKWWDIATWLVFIGLVVVDFESIDFLNETVSEETRLLLLFSSMGMQALVFQLLHRWIKNAFNYLFLVVIGVVYALLYFRIAHFEFASQNIRSIVSMALWIPFLLVLQLFRIIKLKTTGIELSLPIFRSSTLFSDPATDVDLVAWLACVGMMVGPWCWINAA